MSIHPIPLKTQCVKLLNGWKNVLVICLLGLKTTEWKLTQKNATFLLIRKKPLVTSDNLKIDINGVKIESCLEQKLLGVIIENQLKFNKHICNILRKNSQKLNALTRIPSYMDQKKSWIIKNSYIYLLRVKEIHKIRKNFGKH